MPPSSGLKGLAATDHIRVSFVSCKSDREFMNHMQSHSTAAIATPDMRVCLRTPIPEIAIAAGHLNDAVTAHLDGRFSEAERLLNQANMRPIIEWTWSLVGKYSEYNTPRFRPSSPSQLPDAQREKIRMPSSEIKRMLHVRYGYHCCFCGTPVIRKQVRNRLISLYPDAVPWGGKKEFANHAAICVMDAQYDHVLPLSSGGGNDLENLVLTCLPCDYGRSSFTLEEMGLFDPRTRKRVECIFSGWDGLERLLH